MKPSILVIGSSNTDMVIKRAASSCGWVKLFWEEHF